MKIKTKTVLIYLTSVFILILFIASIFYIVIFKYIDDIEIKKLNSNFEILNSVLDKEQENIKRTSADWSNWDDTYKFMSGIESQSFIAANLQENTLKQLGLSFMFFIDTKGDMTYSLINDLENEEKDFMIKKITVKENNIYPALTFKSNYESHSGVVIINGKMFVVNISPITSADGKAKSNGNLVIGKIINASFINYINSVIRGNVKLEEVLNLKEAVYSKIEKTEFSAMEHRKMKDINGDMSIVASITIGREEYNVCQFYLRNFIFIYILAAIVTTIIALMGVDKYVLQRIRKINQFIDAVKESKNMKVHLDIEGSDEIASVAKSVNEMLSSLDCAYEDTKAAEERFYLIMGSTNDGYIDCNLLTNEIFMNSEYKNIFGYKKNEQKQNITKNWLNEIDPDSIKKIKDKLKSIVNGEDDYYEGEYKITKPDGQVIWILQKSKVASRDENGEPVRIISTISNITARKQHEEELITLSYYDKLTGLRNRAYIEKKFYKLDKILDSDYSIIIGDLNGLKLTNDTFGHNEGDRLIKRAANMLKNVCSEDDVVARWGGDEFAILIENREYDYVLGLVKKIKQEFEEIDDFNYKVSIALGSARKINKINSETVMNMAEEKMYRSKLIEKSSSRNATIASLEKTLYEKNSETQEHTKRIKILSKKLGQRLNLSLDKLDELELLGSLHDIGKIGIPEQILTKPGKLTAEEWDIMKNHTEIGYRIAMATPGLSHVAFEILYHHEMFDGTGYPQGLVGEQIPILSRLINIVDSFDVMIHKREYKEAFSIKYAIEELRRCSGTQFDPVMVEAFIKILLKNL